MSHVLALVAGVGCPVALVWKTCATPFLAMLRALGLVSPPLQVPCDVDMSGRVVIVTGANTGENVALPLLDESSLAFSRFRYI